MKPVLKILFFLLLFSYNMAYAAPPNTVTCPPVKQLRKNPQTMLWEAPGGWKAYSISFANHIQHYRGAQWEGVNVGNIYCIYQGDAMTFTIILQYHALVFSPIGGQWTKDLKGYKNCRSDDVHECAFKPYYPQQTTDPYQQWDTIRAAPKQNYGF